MLIYANAHVNDDDDYVTGGSYSAVNTKSQKHTAHTEPLTNGVKRHFRVAASVQSNYEASEARFATTSRVDVMAFGGSDD